MSVMTVSGPVDADALGVTLPHEHLLIDLYRVFQPHREMMLNDVDLAVAELSRFAAAGGGTVVEVTTPDLSRDPAGLAEIARRTGVNIVMGTGRYREPFYEASIWERSTAAIAEALVTEIRDGVDGIRPGILGEIGTHGSYVTPAEERVHRAVARAHNETGLAITTHSVASRVALEQLDLFAEEGVDLRRVAVGHCDSYMFSDYHLAVLERGAWLEFDTIRGTYEYQTTRVVEQLRVLVDAGYLDRILLSQDICVDRFLTVYGGGGYAYLVTSFRERLLDEGFSTEQIEKLFVENPRRMLTGDAGSGR